jgi:formylglycine-generating enzyme required for sulfatase activity
MADDRPASPPPSGDERVKPTVTRVPLGRDPTMPIKFRRPPVPSIADDVTPMSSPVTDWRGDDQTAVGTPRPAAPGANEEWLGVDATKLPVAKPSAAPIPATAWRGDDQTAVERGKQSLGSGSGSGSDWKGDDPTQLGVVVISGKPHSEANSGSSSSKLGKTPTHATAPAFGAGWHLAGRQGALTGLQIGDYELGGILGEGGMGTVYRACQLSLTRRAAVKVLPSNLAADLRLRARFEAEARTASLLNSPHVVQVFGAGTHGDVVYFAMEYVEGTDLSDIVHAKREAGEHFTPEEAAGYIIQAARGLAEAGKQGIIHRDIKPANLMVTTMGVVKIADFGISKVAGEHGMTMTGTAVGTPTYCSPEQGRGDTVTPSADIYSLGVVFYELLAGRKPFDGSTANALIYQHNYQEPPLLTQLRPGLPDAYQAVCLKCLMKAPAQRYSDASELVADLERVRDGSMTMTAVFHAKFGTGAEEAMAKYLGVRRRWWLKWALAAVFLLFFGGGGLWYYSTTSSQRLAQQQQRQAAIEEHKARLRPLDSATPIPRSATDDIGWLSEELGFGDADLLRWQTKIDRVVKLQALLAVLDGDALPSLADRQRAGKDLTAYIDEVGRGGDDVIRWTARLAETEQRGEELRLDLARELDQAEVLPAALRQRTAPAVAELVRLVGAEDSDALRWTARLAETEADLAQQRKALATLDAPDAVVTEALMASLTLALARFDQLADPQDPDGVRWRLRLSGERQGFEGLAKTLSEALDRDLQPLTSSQQDALRPYLERYRARVAASDLRAIAWSRRIDESAARIESLRKNLAAGLDQAGTTRSETALSELSETLDSYAVLVPPDDARLALWSARLRSERESIDADRAILAKFEQLPSHQHLQLTARAACEQAFSRLDARAALLADRKGLIFRRLEEEKQFERTLREDLAQREQDVQTATQKETLDKLDVLENLAGRQDPDVKRWRVRLERYFVLRDALIPLDERVTLPQDAETNLPLFAKIVGDNNEQVVRWRQKLARVKSLRTALAGIENAQPLPAGALENANELVERWLGPDDVQARSWQTKAQRATALRTQLTEWFGARAGSGLASNYVLPTGGGAAAVVDELIALTGDREMEVRQWRYRVLALTGPGRPAWATAYGRDAFGPWAEFTVGNTVQRMRYVPPGTFTLGSPEDEAGRKADERQVPEVVLTRGLWLADSECVQALWLEVMGTNPSRFQHASDALEHPVERVSWGEAQAFCSALAAKLGHESEVRLPSEAEWEYAARAGVEGRYPAATGSLPPEQLSDIAWFGLSDGTRAVRRRQPNRLGLFDMLGNVSEWCVDRSGAYSPVEIIDPVGRLEETRIARGGAWADPPRTLRVANRLSLKPDLRTLYVGFRFAISAWPQGKEPQRPEAAEVSSK